MPIASELFLVGYPAEFEQNPQPTISRGVLSRVRSWDALDITYLQTDAAIAGGYRRQRYRQEDTPAHARCECNIDANH